MTTVGLLLATSSDLISLLDTNRPRPSTSDLAKGHTHWQVCGIPEVLYTDNGSDFKSKHIEQVAIDLKIQLLSSLIRRGPL